MDWDQRYPRERTETATREGTDFRFEYRDASEGERRAGKGELLAGVLDSGGEFHAVGDGGEIAGVSVRMERTEEDGENDRNYVVVTRFRVRVKAAACPVRLLVRRLMMRSVPEEGIDESASERLAVEVVAAS